MWCIHRADLRTATTTDAGIGIDAVFFRSLLNAVHRAFSDASAAANAIVTDCKGHHYPLFLQICTYDMPASVLLYRDPSDFRHRQSYPVMPVDNPAQPVALHFPDRAIDSRITQANVIIK